MNKTKEFSRIFFTAIGFRIVIYCISALIMAFKITDGALTLDTFLANWCRWDSNHYINIATNGYRGAVEFCDTCREAALTKGISPEVMQNGQHLFLVFFPLYPYTLRFANLFFPDIRMAGMFLSSLTYAFGCVYMYRLIKLDYGSTIAQNSVILISLFPFSFFFGGIMTEGLFLFISAAMLYYIRKHKWWPAILFGCLATLTRLQGTLLIIPAGLELLCVYRPWDMIRTKDYSKLKEMIGRGLSLLLMLSGTVIYLFINWKVDGYPLSFLLYQDSHWHNGACLPTKTLSYVFQNAFSTDYNLQMRCSLWLPQAILAISAILLLLYGIKKLRAFHMGYAIAYTLLTYSVKWLISAGRYFTCCIPLFLVLGIITEKRKWTITAFTAIFAMLQIIYLTAYFNGMQIL